MKFSEAWLREWVDPDLNREELFHQLTMAGLEVDSVEPVAETFSGVVVALVEHCEPHPNADKLSLCTVFDGSERTQVVCGAPNARAGLVSAYATIGAVLPGNFKIKKAKLRGIESFGMLCSAAELGLGDDHDGILELPDQWQVGADLTEPMQLDDVTVDLNLTPNRGDCLSLRGLAREVGVLNNLPVHCPPIEAVSAQSDVVFPVELVDAEGCPRYLGRVISGVDLSKPTPHWMKERLRRSGLRSIDAAVDVTNYVLIELGQPMHAFDLNQLSNGIVVRKAQAGETLTLLDGQVVELDNETLLIADASGPVAMAGIMGGERSGVQENTRDVFLECAFFSTLVVAGTARRYGLQTDASHRYERGVDFELQTLAMHRATRLLLDIVGGVAGPLVETSCAKCLPQVQPVRLRQHRLETLMGTSIEAEKVDEAFSRLGFEVVAREGGDAGISWQIMPPSHRFDIALEIDLVEEVCRIYGYNNIPSKKPTTPLGLRSVKLESSPEVSLKAHLASAGFQEIVTYSFIDPKLQDLLDPSVEPMVLANPMSSEQSVMRTNLMPGLIDAVLSNRARQSESVKLFELGNTFVPSPTGLKQVHTLGGVMWGRRQAEAWDSDNNWVDFFDVKGVVDKLLSWAGVGDIRFEPSDDSVLHPGQCAGLWHDGVRCGRLGRLHPELESHLGIEGVFVFEISAALILERPRRVHRGISKYPSVRRDIAIVVAKTVSAVEVEKAVRDAIGGILVDFRLFDVYEGKGIDSNEKSLALGLTLQSQVATLTDEEIGQHAQAAVNALESAVKARLR